MFENAVYCLTPNKNADAPSVNAVEGLAKAVGAYPYFIDPGEHDGYVAGISHLPIAISTALVRATAKSPSWSEMSKLASSGFRDVSRLALGDPIMNHDIFVSNRTAISHWIGTLVTELNGIRELLEETPLKIDSISFVPSPVSTRTNPSLVSRRRHHGRLHLRGPDGHPERDGR